MVLKYVAYCITVPEVFFLDLNLHKNHLPQIFYEAFIYLGLACHRITWLKTYNL